MSDIRLKILDLINKQNRQIRIPPMGFSDYFTQSINAPDLAMAKNNVKDNESDKLSDQEILDRIESIYFTQDFNVNFYILKKISEEEITCEKIQYSMKELKQQQIVISKKVLEHILEQRNACNEQFQIIGSAERELEETLWICKKARSYLSYAKKDLTITSLEILANYRKREVLKDLLKSLSAIKVLKSADIEMQKLLMDGNFPGAISLLLECKVTASEFTEYICIQSLNQKMQETLILIEHQIEVVLNEMIQNFDVKKYAKIQEAFKLLNKSMIAMDQLHISFISAIHSTVNSILKTFIHQTSDEKQKHLIEQLCEEISVDRYIPCLINLCKSFWMILSSYYQIIMWHQNYKLFQNEENDWQDDYILQKLKKGQSRVWNDIQSKLCTYLSSSKLKILKYEQFIQVLSIVQRLQTVGLEFCGEKSDKLLEIMKLQSEKFFKSYHISCLEEICLFLDNESWALVDSFKNITQLQEFRFIKHSIDRRKSPALGNQLPTFSAESEVRVNSSDELVSTHSQEGSSIDGLCGYFLRFSEKSSPFDAGLDATMFEEDVLSGIIDEASCYFSEDTDDEENKYCSWKLEESVENNTLLLANNTTLNILRYVGKYLQMCKLLHCISPQIVASMLELIAFYIYVVHEVFGKDCAVPTENLYDEETKHNLESISKQIAPKIKDWPLNFSSLVNNELCNPDTLFGLSLRIVGIESAIYVMKELKQLKSYFAHLLPVSERKILQSVEDHYNFAVNISKIVYMCVASKVVDLQTVLSVMGKVKWDVNHVSIQYNTYVDTINRSVQTFAMRLDEISKEVPIPFEKVWYSLSHVSTHLLVEGFSNAKKCSAGGRALMQLDFTQFMSILELISGFKFTKHRNYVDCYIKAYYFPVELFEDWIKTEAEKMEYSIKQLVNLINCVCANDKKRRQKLLGLIQNLTELN